MSDTPVIKNGSSSLQNNLLMGRVFVFAAIAGLVNPLIAALVMASSSLIVIGNALRAGRG